MISRQDVVILISNFGETTEPVPIIHHVGSLRHLVERRIDADAKRHHSAGAARGVRGLPGGGGANDLCHNDARARQRARHGRHAAARLLAGGFPAVAPGWPHRGERLPLVLPDASMSEVIVTMTSKSFGIAGVVDDGGHIVGVTTDGGLRRDIDRLTSAVARQVMTVKPRVITAATIAEDALTFLNAQKVTALFVVADDHATTGKIPIGLVDVHDFLRLGMKLTLHAAKARRKGPRKTAIAIAGMHRVGTSARRRIPEPGWLRYAKDIAEARGGNGRRAWEPHS